MSKALDGVRILDFTHVQSGPTLHTIAGVEWGRCDQGREAGAGELHASNCATSDVDSLYFTMLNHNKRSVTLDTKSEQGKQVLEKWSALRRAGGELCAGALDRMGFTWERFRISIRA